MSSNVKNIVYSDTYIEDHLICYVEALDGDMANGNVYECSSEDIESVVGIGGLYRHMDDDSIYLCTEHGDFCFSDLNDCKEMKRLGILSNFDCRY